MPLIYLLTIIGIVWIVSLLIVWFWGWLVGFNDGWDGAIKTVDDLEKKV